MENELNHLRCSLLDKPIGLVTHFETTLGSTPSRLKRQEIHPMSSVIRQIKRKFYQKLITCDVQYSGILLCVLCIPVGCWGREGRAPGAALGACDFF